MAPKPKPRPSPSPSQPPPPIEDLFTSLNKHIQRSEFEQAVKVADQGLILRVKNKIKNHFICPFFIIFFFHSEHFLIALLNKFPLFFFLVVLSIAPGDEDAIRCKVVALIRADDIDKAFSTIQSSQRLPVDFSFFKVGNCKHFWLRAYSFYYVVSTLRLFNE